MKINWTLLRSISKFWDRDSNLFNLSYNEMVPTFDECCVIMGMPRGGPIALPRQDRVTPRAILELLGLPLSECEAMVHGMWVDITSLPRKFMDVHRPQDSFYQRRRENAFALCMFAQFLFVGYDGMVDAQVVELVLQARGHRHNLIPIILGETIHGIGELSEGKAFMQRGSPLLLMVWVCEHFKILSPPSPNDTIWTYRRRKTVCQYDTASDWEGFFATRDTHQINWTISHWNLQVFLPRTTGYVNVLLPGLRYTTYYLACRVLRQFGLYQSIPSRQTSPETGFQLSPKTSRDLQLSWGPASRDTKIIGTKGSIFLDEKYLTWLEAQVGHFMAYLEPLREKLIGGGIYEPSIDLRKAEALEVTKQKGLKVRESEKSVEDYLSGDFYKTRRIDAERRNAEDLVRKKRKKYDD